MVKIMKKITVALILIIVAALLTATVLGLQNGAPESQDAVSEPPEFARDTALCYILQSHEEELGLLDVPSSWTMKNLTPGLLGASNLQYTSGSWNVTVSYLVVLEPSYTIDIDYNGEISFQWVGSVSHNWAVAETSFTVIQ